MDQSSQTTPPDADGSQHNTRAADDRSECGQTESAGAVTAAQSSEKSNCGDPLSVSWRDEPLNPDEVSKVTQILQACKDQDSRQLVALAATSGGFVEDHVRRLACM